MLLYGGVIEVVGGRWSFVVRGVGLVAGSLFMGCGSSFRFVDQVAAGMVPCECWYRMERGVP